jgi:hypothetical protein
VADDRDQIAMATGLCPQNAEAVLAIMEGDTLDKARQYFLGRSFLLWPHLCCRCWRQSPQPDLETCAALALLVSDAVPASTRTSRWRVGASTPEAGASIARTGAEATNRITQVSGYFLPPSKRLFREQIGQVIRARTAHFINPPGQHERAYP